SALRPPPAESSLKHRTRTGGPSAVFAPAINPNSGVDMPSDQMARTGQTDETNRLISSDKVDGTTVYTRNGDNIGSINHLMIDKVSGQVEYVVMSTGGFLGIG